MKHFASEAERKIRKRSKSHGKIPFPPKVKSLAQSLNQHIQSANNVSFSDFVKNVQLTNAISLKTSRVQSKVVLIFLKYKKEREDSTEETPVFIENLIVVLLKDKSALQFGDDGIPLGTEIIDFEDVMQGAIIDINEFSSAVKNKNEIDVSFINGSGGTTDYFIDFFDAKDVIKNKESVSNVLSALDDFTLSNNLKRKQRELCESKVKEHIEFNERHNLTTKLQDLSNVIYQALKKDRNLNVTKSSFEDYVQEYNYKVNEEFTVSKNERDKLEFISLQTEVGALKLKKSHFNRKGQTSNVKFNKNNNELTLKTKIQDPLEIDALTKLQDD